MGYDTGNLGNAGDRMRILVVEDEAVLNQVIVKTLQKEHYTVDFCLDGKEALSYIQMGDYDAILLDIMLPEKSGLEVLKTIRESKDKTPVLLLTAKDSIEDRVRGLDGGADDYLVKPFALDELLARIRVMIRRRSGNARNIFEIADLKVDCDSRMVTRANKLISLSAKEFSVLEYLLYNVGIVLSREKISQHIWNYDYDGSSNVVDVYIRYLRKKIDDDYPLKLIHTIRGAGYVLKIEEREQEGI